MACACTPVTTNSSRCCAVKFSLKHCNDVIVGTTENARKRKCGAIKKQGVEMREKKMRHKIAGVENAGRENAAQELTGGKCEKSSVCY